MQLSAVSHGNCLGGPGGLCKLRVPVQVRELSEPMQLGKYKVPAKTRIWLNVLGMHHDEKLFPEPQVSCPGLWAVLCYGTVAECDCKATNIASSPHASGLQALTACRH